MTGAGQGPNLSIPGYEDFESLGSGGFSRVWKAYQPGVRRWVAVKVLMFDILDEQAIRSFERECQNMGQVSGHPNIVTVISPGITDDDRPYIIMEYYGGGTYAERVRHGPLDIDEVLRLGVKISGALHAAHGAGILHRDIKPHNIFLSEYNVPALGDFGISTVERERTASGNAMLTVHYAPPEVLEGRQATVQSDIYSLGATFHHLIEGAKPFSQSDDSLRAAAIRILTQPAPPITRGDCPPQLASLIRRMMAKDPSDRPPSAASVAEAFQEIQRAIGVSVTEKTFETQTPPNPPTAPVMAAESVRVESPSDDPGTGTGVTIARPVHPTVPEAPPAALEREPAGRRMRSLVALVGAVIILSGAAIWGLNARDSGAATSTTTSGLFEQDDDLFDIPIVPQDVRVVLEGDAAEVSWSDSGVIESDRFRVQRVDAGAPDSALIEVEASPATLSGISEGEIPCVQVQMVRGSALSAWSSTSCASSSGD